MAKVRVQITVKQVSTETERHWFSERPVWDAWEARVSGTRELVPFSFWGRYEHEALKKAQDYLERWLADREVEKTSTRVALDETYDIA